jgi:hypothetical protein
MSRVSFSLACVCALVLGSAVAVLRARTGPAPAPAVDVGMDVDVDLDGRGAARAAAPPDRGVDRIDRAPAAALPPGDDPLAPLALSVAERLLVHELDRLGPPATTRPLAALVLGGYHQAEIEGARPGATMQAHAQAQLAALKRDLPAALAAMEGALRTTSLSTPELAYGRGTLFAAMSMLGTNERVGALALEEITTTVAPARPRPTPAELRAASPEERARLSAASPVHGELALVHALFLDATPDRERALRGTIDAIVAQQDPSMRARFAAQLVGRYGELDLPLRQALARAGIALGGEG